MPLKLHSLISAIILSLLVHGQGAAAQETSPAERLQQVESEISKSRERQSSMAERADAAATELKAISAELVRQATKVRKLEATITDIETRIAALDQDIQNREENLDAQRQQMTATLAALERMSQRPSELAIFRPTEADDTARSAILMSAVIPELESRANSLRAELDDLRQVKDSRTAELTDLESSLDELKDDRAHIEDLLEQRKARREALLAEVEAENRHFQDLAREAEDLRDLVERLSREGEHSVPEPGDFSSRPFSTAHGALPMPAAGEILERFGEKSEVGTARGIRIHTRPGAQVVAPYDGRVVFAGPFRTYGELLIISHSEGYHSLLAGMNRVQAEVGQWVLAGEPVGLMSAQNPSAGSEESKGNGRTLYMELRHNGEPVDPLPWLNITRKVGGP